MPLPKPIHVVGAGLAGAEASWQISRAGVPVILHEMRPVRTTNAHLTDTIAELVCSNSFRSDDAKRNSVGLLHEEMRRCDSVVMKAGDANRVPAGSAMAVDRVGFSQEVQSILEAEPLVTVIREEISDLKQITTDQVIIATGPLTSSALAQSITKLTGEDSLAFFDAIAPIIHFETINMNIAWWQSRYDKSSVVGNGNDYINCPLTRQEYEIFVSEIRAAEKNEFKDWEKNTPYFESCLPIEIMAERGLDTPRWGPMKPVGLTNKHKPMEKPWAVVQLRQDNSLGTLFNMVGFQTKLKHGEQVRLFRTIPGLENAEFARLGGIHRNTFINSPKTLDDRLRLKREPRIRFAGQITGVEGYVESAAMGLIAGRFAAAENLNKVVEYPPLSTALGALLKHITDPENSRNFQPMNINFGLFPPLAARVSKDLRKEAYTRRARTDLENWLSKA